MLRGLEPSLWISPANLAFWFLLKVRVEKLFVLSLKRSCHRMQHNLPAINWTVTAAFIKGCYCGSQHFNIRKSNRYIFPELLHLYQFTLRKSQHRGGLPGHSWELKLNEYLPSWAMPSLCAMKTKAKCLHTYSITTLTVTGGKVQEEFLDEHLFYFRRTKCRDSTTKAQKRYSWISLRPWRMCRHIYAFKGKFTTVGRFVTKCKILYYGKKKTALKDQEPE